MAIWSLQDAETRFGAVVEAARTEPQTVTRHGRPVAVVIDAAEYESLRQLKDAEKPSFAELLLAIPRQDEDADAFGRMQVGLRDPEL